MLGRVPSHIVIAISLLLAVSSLFVRNIVYSNHQQPETSHPDEGQDITASTIVLSYTEHPPYYVTSRNGALAGLAGGPAITAFQRSGLPFTTQRLTPQRQLKSIKNNTLRTCAIGWPKTPERELYARFTLPFYQDLPTAALTRADLKVPPENLTVAGLFSHPELTLLIQSGYSYGEYIDQHLQKASLNIVTTPGSIEHMLDIIASGKADYFFAATEVVKAAISASNTPQTFQLLMLNDIPPGSRHYIMCSKLVTPEEITSLDLAIATSASPESSEGRN